MLKILLLTCLLHADLGKIATLEGDDAAEQFGFKADWAGDVNGDGYDDFIVGAPGALTGSGRVRLYLGGPHGLSKSPAWVFEGEHKNDNLGKVVAGLGDVNGDGYDDIYMDAPEYDGKFRKCGKIYVFYGGPRGPGPRPDWSLEGSTEEEHLGDCASPAGDVNGDGFDDLAVGAYGYDHYRGRAFIFHGGPKGFGQKASWEFRGEHVGDWFGYGIGPAGDINGDGFGDMVFGAKNHVEKGGSFSGKVYSFLGSKRGLAAKPQWSQAGREANSLFGNRIVGVGDVDGDGWPDIATGAPLEAKGKGAGYVFYGSSKGIDASRVFRVEGTREKQGLAYMVAPAGDLNVDGFNDVLFGGMAQFTVPGSFQPLMGGPLPILGTRVDEAALGGSLGGCLGLAGETYGNALVFVSRAGAGKNATLKGAVDLLYFRDNEGVRLLYSTELGGHPRYKPMRGRVSWKRGQPFSLVNPEGDGLEIYFQRPGGKREASGLKFVNGKCHLESALLKIKSPWVRVTFSKAGDNTKIFDASAGRLGPNNLIFIR